MNPASLRFVSGRADHLASYVAAETNENVRKHETICIGVLVSQRMNDALVLRQRQEEGCPTYVHRSFLFVSFHSLCFSLSLSHSYLTISSITPSGKAVKLAPPCFVKCSKKTTPGPRNFLRSTPASIPPNCSVIESPYMTTSGSR